MSQSEPIPFRCPSCEAEYKIITIEACDVVRGKIRCLKCDALFPAGEGRVAFKYFLVGRPSGRIEDGNDWVRSDAQEADQRDRRALRLRNDGQQQRALFAQRGIELKVRTAQ
jgi:hypothetical protein